MKMLSGTSRTIVDNLTSIHNLHTRSARSLGPLLWIFLANILPNLALTKITSVPSAPLISIPHLESSNFLPIMYDSSVSSIPWDQNYYTIDDSENHYRKQPVKRSISQQQLKYKQQSKYTQRRRLPAVDYNNKHDLYYDNDDDYDYTVINNRRFKNKNRNRKVSSSSRRKPVSIDDDYDDSDENYDDYKSSLSLVNKKQIKQYPNGQRKNNKVKNKQRDDYDTDYYNDDNVGVDDSVNVEPVTVIIRQQRPFQRQQKQKTTTTMATTIETTTSSDSTNITNGTTSSSTTETTIAPSNGTINSTDYGYGPYTGNEGVSITYGPPTANKPIYGVLGSSYYVPLSNSDWSPSYSYNTPSNQFANTVHDTTSYHTNSYGEHINPFSSTYSVPFPSESSSSSSSSVFHGTSSIVNPSSSYPSSSYYSSPRINYSPNIWKYKPNILYGGTYNTNNNNKDTSASLYGVPKSTYKIAYNS